MRVVLNCPFTHRVLLLVPLRPFWVARDVPEDTHRNDSDVKSCVDLKLCWPSVLEQCNRRGLGCLQLLYYMCPRKLHYLKWTWQPLLSPGYGILFEMAFLATSTVLYLFGWALAFPVHHIVIRLYGAACQVIQSKGWCNEKCTVHSMQCTHNTSYQRIQFRCTYFVVRRSAGSKPKIPQLQQHGACNQQMGWTLLVSMVYSILGQAGFKYVHTCITIVSPLWPNPVESKMSVNVCTLGLTLEVINVVNRWKHGHDFTNVVAMWRRCSIYFFSNNSIMFCAFECVDMVWIHTYMHHT